MEEGEMTDSLQFCYWLNGFLELSDTKELTEGQLKCVREHLQLVFKKVTFSSRPSPYDPSERVCFTTPIINDDDFYKYTLPAASC